MRVMFDTFRSSVKVYKKKMEKFMQKGGPKVNNIPEYDECPTWVLAPITSAKNKKLPEGHSRADEYEAYLNGGLV
jgi:hypothetical protein